MSTTYRRLSNAELEELKDEFIKFLSANTITGPDWKKMKTENKEKAEALIDTFSDIVMQKVLEKVEYVEHREPKTWWVFHCKKESIIMLHITSEEGADIDFTDTATLQQIDQVPISVHRAEKDYNSTREKEVFDMIQKGCSITDDRLFKMLDKQ